MNGVQWTKPAGIYWNRLLDALVTILKYKNITIDHDIYIKVFTYVTVSCIIVSTYDVLNTTNNETAFPELTSVFKEHFDMKVQYISVLKYLKFRICQSPLGINRFYIFSNHDISNISNLSNPTITLILASQTKCDNMFSYPQSDHIFSFRSNDEIGRASLDLNYV